MTELTANPKALIEHVAKALVSAPDQVRVEEVPEGDEIVLELEVAEDDMGRVIGKSGKVARAMRNLLHAAATSSTSITSWRFWNSRRLIQTTTLLRLREWRRRKGGAAKLPSKCTAMFRDGCMRGCGFLRWPKMRVGAN